MKTGDIILVHSTSKLARIIQKFQMRKDKEAGYYNHSGLVWVDESGTYVVEMAEVRKRKVRANTVFTPIDEYGGRELLLLTPIGPIDTIEFKRIVYDYVGTPYDYNNLLRHQVVRLLTGVWIGRKKKKADKRMVCHEFVQKIWDDYSGIFPEWNQAKVSNIYHSTHFKKVKI